MGDWRSEQAEHLRGLTLWKSRYTRWSAEWDHDHCAGCSAKFMEGNAGALHEGYTTGPDYKHGARYEWLCEQCFSDLKDELNFVAWIGNDLENGKSLKPDMHELS